MPKITSDTIILKCARYIGLRILNFEKVLGNMLQRIFIFLIFFNRNRDQFSL